MMMMVMMIMMMMRHHAAAAELGAVRGAEPCTEPWGKGGTLSSVLRS